MPLREVSDINARYVCTICCRARRMTLRLVNSLDAVQDLLNHPTFEQEFTQIAKGLPDLERIVSRIHAKNCKVKDFLKVLTVRSLFAFLRNTYLQCGFCIGFQKVKQGPGQSG